MTDPQALHKCAMPDCDRGVLLNLLMCRDHWWAVPKDVQRRVYDAYRALQRGATVDTYREHAAAREAAIQAVLDRDGRIAAVRSKAR